MAEAPKQRSPEDQLETLRRGAVEIISEEDLLAKLRERRSLRVKLGLDPSAPDLHIGSAIVLRKLRQFQDLGHEAIIVIGDFTALIGDPTGRNQTRRMLTPEQVEANAATYRDQYGRILDPARTRLTFNSQWLSPLHFADVISVASKTTVARILERDDFQPRLRGGDGVEKMSKSLGNAIGITDPPGEMYGKVMSIPDGAMPEYFEFATDVPADELARITRGLADSSLHPRAAKRRPAAGAGGLGGGAGTAAAAGQG